MKVSLNSLRKYQKQFGWSGDVAPDGPHALIEKIGAQLAGIEEVISIGPKYQDIIVVHVVDCVPHDNSDHLNVCMIDDGGVAEGVTRDERGYVQVVCGAPNVRAGLTVAWLPPGATVPSSYESEPFVLSIREIRGKVSHGMLASPQELALGDSHDGILEITDEITPGTMFADVYNLRDDIIIDMENKMFTHRPDCFGVLGVAREIAGIQGQSFKSPKWYRSDASIEGTNELPLVIRNEASELVRRFSAVVIEGITVGPSPVWLQVELAKLGLRPINNIVDLTNYHMLLTGQPLHAYDYDKVAAVSGSDVPTIIVRTAHADESLELLNGKKITSREGAILITTPSGPIGLAGVMGGASTEVDSSTTRIILESASFDMYSIRRTSMAHGLFSDAVTRFSKGQSPLQTVAVLALIAEDIVQMTGAHVASELIDDNQLSEEQQKRSSLYQPVQVSVDFINRRLGSNLSVDAIVQLLRNVEFAVEQSGDELTITAPFWRTDIEIAEDIVEEVGRLHGYDNLPKTLPRRDITPAHKDQMFELKREIRDVLSRSGANEALTYSFVDGKLLEKVGQDREQAYKLSNALSPDLQYYRLSLTPSLLDKVHGNIKAGYDSFALFEMGKAHVICEPDPFEPTVPKEVNALSFVFARKSAGNDAPYYQAKMYLQELLNRFVGRGTVRFEMLEEADLYNNTWILQMTRPFVPNRSAVLRDADGMIWGVVGEYKPAIRRALKLPDYTAGFEIDPLLFIQFAKNGSSYQPQSKYPSVWQDICLKVSSNMTYADLEQFVTTKLEENRQSDTTVIVEPIDIYQREDDADYKQITFRVTVTSYGKTMTDTEVNRMLDEVASAARETFAAERI